MPKQPGKLQLDEQFKKQLEALHGQPVLQVNYGYFDEPKKHSTEPKQANLEAKHASAAPKQTASHNKPPNKPSQNSSHGHMLDELKHKVQAMGSENTVSPKQHQSDVNQNNQDPVKQPVAAKNRPIASTKKTDSSGNTKQTYLQVLDELKQGFQTMGAEDSVMPSQYKADNTKQDKDDQEHFMARLAHIRNCVTTSGLYESDDDSDDELQAIHGSQYTNKQEQDLTQSMEGSLLIPEDSESVGLQHQQTQMHNEAKDFAVQANARSHVSNHQNTESVASHKHDSNGGWLNWFSLGIFSSREQHVTEYKQASGVAFNEQYEADNDKANQAAPQESYGDEPQQSRRWLSYIGL